MSEFEIVAVDHKAAMEAPSVEIFRENGVYAHSSLIPETYTHAKRIFFVCGTNGDEYGQFATSEKALAEAIKLSKMSETERSQLDQ